MIMKRIFKTSIFLAISLMATTTFTSCEDYLDKNRNLPYQVTMLSRISQTFKVLWKKYTTVFLTRKSVIGVLHGTGEMMKFSIPRQTTV